MRNTVVVDMVNGGIVTAVDAVADDENTINLLVYTGSGANPQIHITTRDIEETITGFESDSIYFYEIPSEYYPEYIFDADNNMYVTLSDASQERTIRFHWSGAANGYMKLTKDTDYRYFVVYQKIMSSSEVVQAVEETQQAIENLPETITETASTSTVANNVNSFNLDGIFESIMTNIKPILLKYTAADTYEYVNTPPSNGIRNYIIIKENYIQFIEAHLPSGNTFAAAATTLFTLGGEQVYYTSITGSGAYKYLTFTSPTILSGSGVDVEQYKVRIPTPTATYIKSQYQWRYDSSISSYLVELLFGTGDANGRGIYKFVKDANSGMLVYTSRITGAVLGIKITDEGVWYTQDGVNWKLIGDSNGGNVKIIDHAPTEADLTGENTVFVRYDETDTPVIEGSIGTLFNALNTYVEVPTIQSVIITPSETNVYKGYTQQFTANVAVTWSIYNQQSSGTTISANGLLTVSSDETSNNIYVQATSTVDVSKTAYATVNISSSTRLYLFDNGDEHSDITGGWTSLASVGSSYQTSISDTINVSVGGNTRCALGTANKINVQNYQTLVMEFDAAVTNTSNAERLMFIEMHDIQWCWDRPSMLGAGFRPNNAVASYPNEVITANLVGKENSEGYLFVGCHEYEEIHVKRIWL